MDDIVRIRFEVDGMKHAIITAIHARNLDIDSHIERAVKEFCEPGNLDATIRKLTAQVIHEAIGDGINSFFRYGPGSSAIREAIFNEMTQKNKEKEKKA